MDSLSNLKSVLGIPQPSLKEVLGMPDPLKEVLSVDKPLQVDPNLFKPVPTPAPVKKPSIMDRIKGLKDRITKK
jgi:hypothetical protein